MALRYYRIEHSGHKTKSAIKSLFHLNSGALLLLFVQQACQNIARISSICLSTECRPVGWSESGGGVLFQGSGTPKGRGSGGR